MDPKKEFLMDEKNLLQKEFQDPIQYHNTSGLQLVRELLNDVNGQLHVQQKCSHQLQFILELPWVQQEDMAC